MVENIENECNKLLDEISKNIGKNEAINLEQKLWSSIQKAVKSTNQNSNSSLMNYLIGLYNSMHEILFLNSQSNDPFLSYNRYGYCQSMNNNEYNNNNDVKITNKLLYNIYIRLGDLYRYSDSRINAKCYYKRSLLLNPKRGLAYNQLSLCTPLTSAYQCLYYSIRALRSIEDPVRGAETNIKLLLARFDSPLFERFRQKMNVKLNDNPMKISSPTSGIEWFYLVIISIHFNDLNSTIDLLLDRLIGSINNNQNGNNSNDSFSYNSIQFDYLLMSLDVAFDWILKERKNESLFNDKDNNNGQQIDNIKIINIWLNSTSDFNKIDTDCSLGLLHNFILKDFEPLNCLYMKMDFYYETESYQIDKHRKILVSRLVKKLQTF